MTYVPDEYRLPPPQRALIVDDHPMIARGLAHLLGALVPELAIVTATTLDEAVRLHATGFLVNDIAFVDLALPDSKGLDTLLAVRAIYAEQRIAIFSGDEDAYRMQQCFRAGAAAFIPKNLDPAAFETAVATFVQSGAWFPETMLAISHQPNLLDRWTPKRVAIAKLLEQGLTNKEIAVELGQSPHTIHSDLKDIARAFGIPGRRAAIVARARQDKVIQ